MRNNLLKSLTLPILLAATSLSKGPTVGGTCPTLPADSIWNTPIDQLPVHPSSSTWVTTIGAATKLHPDFGQSPDSGIPFILVPGTSTKYPVTFTYPSESDSGPYTVPLNAPIEGGSASTGDRHALAIDTTGCILYELYNSHSQTASWKADSGAIYHLQSDALRPDTWTSADAAGLPIFPGLVRYDEILAGEIKHAMRLTVPHTQKAHVWPARHDASSLKGAQYPPMGTRFRLKTSFDISKYSRTNQIILRALQVYGMMLADNGSAWFITGAPDSRWDDSDLHHIGGAVGASFEAVDVAPLMVNINSGQAHQNYISVHVTPGAANVQADAHQQFTAVVAGTSNHAVIWEVNGAVGGSASVGYIDSISGLYTAPASTPSPATVVVRAVSKIAPTAIGAAQVTITNPPPPVTVTVAPATLTLGVKATHQFTATVKNTANAGVIWKVNSITGGSGTVGTISAVGLYTAPATIPSASVILTAVSVADTTKSATAHVTVTK